MDNTNNLWQTMPTEEGEKALVETVTDYEKFKKRLFITVMNTAANEAFLAVTPHREVEDLSITANMAVDPAWFGLPDGKTLGTPVTHDLARKAGIDPDMLLEDAFENSPELRPVEPPVPLGSFTRGREPRACPCFVLTNKARYKGAAALFYPGVMGKCRDAIGSDYYILPSSVHEVLLMPVGHMEPEAVRAMVQAVNADPDVISPEDWLSDNVYLYSGEGGFGIAAAG